MHKHIILKKQPPPNYRNSWRHPHPGLVQFRALACVFLALATVALSRAAQGPGNARPLQLDPDGSVYAVAGDNTRIKLADSSHCSVYQGTVDGLTGVCQVTPKPPDNIPFHFLRLEIYWSDGRVLPIETGAEIIEWHYWDDGRQLAVYWQGRSGKRSHVLYDTATAHPVETIADPPDESLLPQWAKDRAQIDDESVPMSSALTEERTKWIAKALRRIQKIRPGMHRSDLEKIFTTEGGLSTRTWRRYVLSECRYIKVDVQFKAATDKPEDIKEDPNDIITSISKPYLQWNILD